MTNNSTYMRPVIPAGNSFYINIALDKFIDGAYEDFDLTKVTDLKVYLICATHNTEIPLDYEIIPGIDNTLKCFVDYRLLHTTSYGIAVEGYDEHDIHFRFLMLPKEGFLVVNNTSGMKVTDDVQVIDISGRVGWGIQTEGDLSNYYTKAEVDNLIAEIEVDLSDYYTKEEISQLLTLYPTRTEINERFNNYYTKTVVDNLLTNKQDTLVSGTNIKTINSQSLLGSGNMVIEGTEQLQSDWTQTDTSAKDYIKHKPTIPAAQLQSDWTQTDTSAKDYIKNKPTIPAEQVNSDWNATSGVAKILNKPDLNNYATKTDLNNYYDKGQTDGLLNNKVDVSTLNSDYYNKNTVDNLLDAKVDTSDLAQVATSGSYNDLTNKPDLSVYATHTELNTKQDTLVSGTNIKTINNESILGSGNIDIDAENNDEVTANALYDINGRLSEAEVSIKSIPQEINAKIVPVNERIDEVSNDVIDLTNDIDNSNLANSLILNELHNEIYETIIVEYGTTLSQETLNKIYANPQNTILKVDTGSTINYFALERFAPGDVLNFSYNGMGIGSSIPEQIYWRYNIYTGSWISNGWILQKYLVSGTDIKTINGNDILGSGDLTVGGSSDPIYYIDIDWQLWPQDPTWQGNQAIYFKSVTVYDLTTGTQVYYGVPGSSKSLSAIFNEIYSQLSIRSNIYIDSLQSDISNYTFRVFNYNYYLMDIPQTIANKQYGNGSVILIRFYEWDSTAFKVKNYCNNIVIPLGPGQHRMVTSTTSGLKVETTSSTPSGTVPVTLAFDSTTNTLYIVQ